MTHIIDSALVTKDLVVGGGSAQEPSQQTAIGPGNDLLHGSCDISGVVHIGRETFEKGESTLMVSTSVKQQGDRAMTVHGNATINGPDPYPLRVGGNAFFAHPNIGDLSARFNTADSKPKPFDMQHPTEGEGYRLRYACIEGPEVGVYFRGRCRNKKEIELPSYWKDLVHEDTITVQLQPVGAHQDIIIKRWDAQKIYLQSNGGLPIDCFYHVYAERKDVNALIVEYKGNSWEDYPDTLEYNDPQFSGVVNTKTK